MSSEAPIAPPQANSSPICRCEGSLRVGATNDVISPAAAAAAGQAAPAREGCGSPAPTAGLFGVAAILGALGTGLCCLAPVLFPLLGVSTLVSLSSLSVATPHRGALFLATVVALALTFAAVIRRRSRRSWVEWVILAASTVAVVGILGYGVSLEGLPIPW